MLPFEAAIVYQEPSDSWKQIVEQANGRPAPIPPALAIGDQNLDWQVATPGRTPTPSQPAAPAPSTPQQQHRTPLQPQGGGSFRKAAHEGEQNTNANASALNERSCSNENEYSSYPVGRTPLVNLAPAAGVPTADAAPVQPTASAADARGTLSARSAGLGFVLGAVSGAHHRQPLAPNRSAPQAAGPAADPASDPFYDPAYDLNSTDM